MSPLQHAGTSGNPGNTQITYHSSANTQITYHSSANTQITYHSSANTQITYHSSANTQITYHSSAKWHSSTANVDSLEIPFIFSFSYWLKPLLTNEDGKETGVPRNIWKPVSGNATHWSPKIQPTSKTQTPALVTGIQLQKQMSQPLPHLLPFKFLITTWDLIYTCVALHAVKLPSMIQMANSYKQQ